MNRNTKSNLAIALGILTPMLAARSDGSRSRSFRESERFRERYFEINKRYFDDDLNGIVQAIMAYQWNAVPPSQIVTSLIIKDLAGYEKGRIVLVPNVSEDKKSVFPILGASVDDKSIYYAEDKPPLIMLKLKYTYDDPASVKRFSKRIQDDAAYRMKLKLFLEQTISHELYHLIDPKKKMKGTAGKVIDQLKNENPTYTMNYVDNFWRKAYCMDDMMEMVMTNPEQFWKEYGDEIAEIVSVDGASVGLPVPAWGSTLAMNIINAIQNSILDKSDI